MRLHATSQETGEILDLAASKGLRLLKRADLDKRWGPFANSTPISCVVPDLSNLTPEQIKKGVNHVLARTLDSGRPPNPVLARNPELGRIPDPIFGLEHDASGDEANQRRGPHELLVRRGDGNRDNGVGQLPNMLPGSLADHIARQDQEMRRPGTSPTGSVAQSGRSLNRDASKRIVDRSANPQLAIHAVVSRRGCRQKHASEKLVRFKLAIGSTEAGIELAERDAAQPTRASNFNVGVEA